MLEIQAKGLLLHIYFFSLLRNETFRKARKRFILYYSAVPLLGEVAGVVFCLMQCVLGSPARSQTRTCAHQRRALSANQPGAAKVQRRSFAKMISRSVLGVFRFLYSVQPRFMSLLCLLNLQETWAQFCLCWQFLGVDSCRLFTRCQGMSNPEHVFLSYSHSLTAEIVCSLSDPFADI